MLSIKESDDHIFVIESVKIKKSLIRLLILIQEFDSSLTKYYNLSL